MYKCVPPLGGASGLQERDIIWKSRDQRAAFSCWDFRKTSLRDDMNCWVSWNMDSILRREWSLYDPKLSGGSRRKSRAHAGSPHSRFHRLSCLVSTTTLSVFVGGWRKDWSITPHRGGSPPRAGSPQRNTATLSVQSSHVVTRQSVREMKTCTCYSSCTMFFRISLFLD